MTPPNDAQPDRLCDLIMKGGITSGIIYPSAACELAYKYSFKNIGGTSAGAIAAAAAAAAECGRRNGKGTAFTGLAALPEWIGQPGRLLKMFTPDAATRTLFELAMAVMKSQSTAGKILSLAAALLRHFSVPALVLTALVVAAWRYLFHALQGALFAYTLGVTIIVAVLVFLVTVLVLLFLQVARVVPKNFYGLSRAFNPTADSCTAEAPLTNWLARFLNELAGKPLADGPLTFGDLYQAKRAPNDPEPDTPDYKAIRLEMMTTALNHGRPYRLPFRDPDQIFFFCPDEFEKLFPKQVVEHMKQHAQPVPGPKPTAPGCSELYRFPKPEDVPVIVATRMSLSFPILLAAVPLYAVDFTLDENKDRDAAHRADRCWFSDGGISSNLPIHFFDAPLPSWPTFAIDLKQFHPDHQDEQSAVWLPVNPNSGWLPMWTRFEKPGAFGQLADFLGAILNAMQNWQDSTQSRVPGYRDRVVHVSQRDDEGGLNLDMPQETVKRLAARGQRAGAALVQRFAEGPGWAEHRWVRFRSCMDLTQSWISEVAKTYQFSTGQDPKMEDILMRPATAPPSSYRLEAQDQVKAKAAMDDFLKLRDQWTAEGTGFHSAPPRPAPELRIKPKV